MQHSRRSLLRATAATLGAAGVLGAGTGTVSAHEDEVIDGYRSADPSNYTDASRGAGDVRWVVMHTIEGSYEAGYSWFENPNANVSSHFVIGNQDGQILQMVDVQDVAWTNGNSEYNWTGVNLELEGYANSTDFNENIYRQSADVVRHVCDKYDVPKRHPTYDIAPCSAYNGRGGVIGHNQIPSPNDCSRVTGGKTDPGSTFDWNYFMSLVRGETGGGGGGGRFEMDQDVHTTADVWVRERPGLDGTAIKVKAAQSPGVVVNGPVDEDGYTWWGIHFTDEDLWAWCPENWLAAGPPQKFQEGDRVEVTASWLNTRERPDTSSPAVRAMPEGAVGEVVNGPVDSDGYTWWGLHWVNYGVWGWSVEDYLQ